MPSYFDQFPTIQYGKKVATNITVRRAFRETMFERYNSYYPYKIKEGERPDMIAYNYYGDSDLVWLVFLANNIIDPYYDWPLTEKQLQRQAIAKYGSIAEADDLLSPAYYNVSDPDVSGVSYRASSDSYKQTYDGDIYGKESATGPKGNWKNYSYTNIDDASVSNVQGVTNWQQMREDNEAKREISLLDKKFLQLAKKELKTLLKDG